MRRSVLPWVLVGLAAAALLHGCEGTRLSATSRLTAPTMKDKQKAILRFGCVKQCKIYLNGKKVFETPLVEDENSWKKTGVADVSVGVGDVLAVQAFSHGPWGGVVGEIECAMITTPTNALGWKYSHKDFHFLKDKDWAQSGFNDTSWGAVNSEARYGNHQFPMLDGFKADSEASWIWGKDRSEHRVFMRYKIPPNACPSGLAGFQGTGDTPTLQEWLASGHGAEHNYHNSTMSDEWTTEDAQKFWEMRGNIAVGRTAVQSSTLGVNEATLAVDGIVDGDKKMGSVSETKYEKSPWWELDLGSEVYVDGITIYRRTDCCAELLDGMYVFASRFQFPKEKDASGVQHIRSLAPVFATIVPSMQGLVNVTIPVQKKARYVRVQLDHWANLQLAEVEVWGRDCDTTCYNGGLVEWTDCSCKCTPLFSGDDCSTCRSLCMNGAKQDPQTCECFDCPEPWRGEHCSECSLSDCVNGGVLDFENCLCRCPGGWSGARCQVCDLDCKHGGTQDPINCRCTGCPPNWNGTECASPVTEECLHGGALDMASATCECSVPWTGQRCEICPIACIGNGTLNESTCTCEGVGCNATATACVDMRCDLHKCYHGGTLDRATCQCSCQYNWGGRDCNSCPLDCANEMQPDMSSCTCDCDLPWTGPSCRTCVRTPQMDYLGVCQHGGLPPVGDQCGCRCHSPWAGGNCDVCSGYCANGGTMDESSCKCKCGGLWSGTQCEDCKATSKDCYNGHLDIATCSCVCEQGRSGPKCEVCDRVCQHGGKLDHNTCECHCPEEGKYWKGPECDVCNVFCKNNGIIDVDSCHCKCQGGWTGRDCGTCALTCAHGKLDKLACRCVCPEDSAWKGLACDKCDRWCNKGAPVNPKTCECECPKPWSGSSCSVCDRVCENLGVLDPVKCSCDCGANYRGDNCEELFCPEEDCGKTGIWDPTRCMCECQDPWRGTNCEVCILDHYSCHNGATFSKDDCRCDCTAPWKGLHCTECGLVNCKNDGVLIAPECRCQCPGNYEGPDCSECRHHCVAGRGVLIPDRCKCDCHKPWVGKSCEECGLQEDSCLNGGLLDRNSCKCKCPIGHKGDLCDECDITECKNGGVVTSVMQYSAHTGRSLPSCKCKCPAPFTGKFCEIVDRVSFTKYDAGWMSDGDKKLLESKSKVTVYNRDDFKNLNEARTRTGPLCATIYYCDHPKPHQNWKYGPVPKLIFKFGPKSYANRPVEEEGPGYIVAGGPTDEVKKRAASVYAPDTEKRKLKGTGWSGSADVESAAIRQFGMLLETGEMAWARQDKNSWSYFPITTSTPKDEAPGDIFKGNEMLPGLEIGTMSKSNMDESPCQHLDGGASQHEMKCSEKHHEKLEHIAASGKPGKLDERCFKMCQQPCVQAEGSKKSGQCFYDCVDQCASL